nr:hypothetical protein [Spirochaeta cellobiosiphila]
MKKKSVSRKELIYRTGVKSSVIDSFLQSEILLPRADQAILIAEALDCPVEYLILGRISRQELINDFLKILFELSRDRVVELYEMGKMFLRLDSVSPKGKEGEMLLIFLPNRSIGNLFYLLHKYLNQNDR